MKPPRTVAPSPAPSPACRHPISQASVALLGGLALLPGPQQPLRCQLALGRQGGLLGFVLDHPILDIRHKDAVALKPPSPDAADFSDAARVYTAIRAVTRLNNEFKEALPSRAEAAVAQYLDAELSADEVDAIVKWLKLASGTSLLGRTVERGRFLGVRRKSGVERTSSQKIALETLQEMAHDKRKRKT